MDLLFTTVSAFLVIATFYFFFAVYGKKKDDAVSNVLSNVNKAESSRAPAKDSVPNVLSNVNKAESSMTPTKDSVPNNSSQSPPQNGGELKKRKQTNPSTETKEISVQVTKNPFAEAISKMALKVNTGNMGPQWKPARQTAPFGGVRIVPF